MGLYRKLLVGGVIADKITVCATVYAIKFLWRLDEKMSNFDYKLSYRRNLPHIQLPGATFFVTFNLAGSLPQSVLQQWQTEKNQLEAEKSRILKSENSAHLASVEHKIFEQKRERFRKFEETLDEAQNGPLWLKEERIAKVVAKSLHHRDGKVYRLDAYCIMANHVHAVFAPLVKPSKIDTADLQDNTIETNSLSYNTLSSIMHSLKGYTARKANQLLGRSGAFWHHESYDHAIRDESEWQRIVTYVLNNPVKAGLVDEWTKWEWSYYRTGFSPE